jgi:ribonuclease J
VENSAGLVIADFSSRNFERLETFQEISRKTGREMVITAKDCYLLHTLQSISGFCMAESPRVYEEISSKSKRKWEQEVVRAQYGDRYVDHASIQKSPDSYILCFSFFDMKHLLDIKLEGGTYIYSACEAFNEEREIDFQRLWHWLQRFDIGTCGLSLNENGDLRFDGRCHVSGHASGEYLIWAIEQIDPDCIVPIHTEAMDWFATNFENVVIVEEGRTYKF